jgi:stage II sporulation protein P
MRRRRRRKTSEKKMFMLTMLCLAILIFAGMREQILDMVYPGISYLSNQETTREEQLYGFVAAFSNGYYGYMEKYQKPSIQVENRSGAQKLLTQQEQEEVSEETGEGQNEGITQEELLQNELMQENLLAGETQEFVKADSRQQVLDYEKMLDFTYLKEHFYTVDSSTSVDADTLDARWMLSYDATISTDASQPQILIYHTHSQEAFADSVPGDTSTTIVGVGEALTQILQDEYGFQVIHHCGVYDVQNRDYAYSAAAPAISQILEENPSIEVVIDLHRDGVADDTHLVTEVGGRPTAQFMFFNGLSYLNSTGDVTYLENPYKKENLAFSFQLKLAADEYYPGFARNIYLKGLRYNMHFKGKSLLIEVGAQTNTVEEVMNATEPIAHILAMVLKGEKP